MLSALLISQIILWLLLIALIILVLALAKQIGVLHERIAPAGALSLDKGPKVGQQAPIFELPDVRGQRLVKIGGQQLKHSLILFVAPTCPVCKKILPIAKDLIRAEKTDLQLILVSDGDKKQHEAFIERYDLMAYPYVSSPDVGISYQVGKLPYALFVDKQGMVRSKGLVNSREHLESLVEAYELGVSSVQDFLAKQQESLGSSLKN